jgi:hypothetical protein
MHATTDPKLFVIGNSFINRSWDISADAKEWKEFQERQRMILQENTAECFDPQDASIEPISYQLGS